LGNKRGLNFFLALLQHIYFTEMERKKEIGTNRNKVKHRRVAAEKMDEPAATE